MSVLDIDTAEQPICDICGLPISEEGQPCPALDNGVCEP